MEGRKVSAGEALVEFFSKFLDDEGSPYALDLMKHYVIGMGKPFVRGRRGTVDLLGWRSFMANRPEIQIAMRGHFQEVVNEMGSSTGPSEGDFVRLISHTVEGESIRLFDLQSMRLTLHGCHRIQVSGRWHRMSAENTIHAFRRPEPPRWCLSLDPPAQGFQLCPMDGSRRSSKEITLYDVWFIWVDKGDLHGKLETVLDSGNRVPDEVFEALKIGKEFDVSIWFKMPGMSIWRYTDYETTHLSGWPPSEQSWSSESSPSRKS